MQEITEKPKKQKTDDGLVIQKAPSLPENPTLNDILVWHRKAELAGVLPQPVYGSPAKRKAR